MIPETISAFETRFKAHRYEPGLASHFTAGEVRSYLSEIAVSSIGYTMYPIYSDLFKAFPAEVWFPVIDPLLDALPLMPQGIPYSAHDTTRYALLADGSYSEKTYNTFHPAVQLIHEALQCAPDLFKDKLDLLFVHEINLYGETEFSFWAAYGGNFYDFFKSLVSGDIKGYQLNRAMVYMLMSGGEQLEALAVATIQEKIDPKDWKSLNNDLLKVGKTWTGKGFEALHSDKPLHMIFPDKYMPLPSENSISAAAPAPSDSYHALNPLPYHYRFGGLAPVKKSGKTIRLHHVLTLDPIPENLSIQSVKRLVLVADLDEMIDESTDAFFRHDEKGNPSMVRKKHFWEIKEDGYRFERREETDEGEEEHLISERPFKECSIRLSDQGERYRFQDGEYGENNFRVGGRPHFIQDYHYPECCDCNQTMHFVLQMDSGITQEGGSDWLWGGGGFGYIYWCDDCRVSSICWFSS